MWIMSPKGFVSIVRKDCPPGHLLVRSRRRECLEALFPDADIVENVGTDYQFRAVIPQLDVINVVSRELIELDYPNHKDATTDDDLHSAYSAVWSIMARLQPVKPFTFLRRGRYDDLFSAD